MRIFVSPQGTKKSMPPIGCKSERKKEKGHTVGKEALGICKTAHGPRAGDAVQENKLAGRLLRRENKRMKTIS